MSRQITKSRSGTTGSMRAAYPDLGRLTAAGSKYDSASPGGFWPIPALGARSQRANRVRERPFMRPVEAV
jgi:hypothetical protein